MNTQFTQLMVTFLVVDFCLGVSVGLSVVVSFHFSVEDCRELDMCVWLECIRT